jgi:outer membrane protein assembly factor BamB
MTKYQIPETLLPFVNTEIAEIEVDGRLHLVSSTWGGRNFGRIYLFDPDTGRSIWRRLPDAVGRTGGAYMLRTGPDGRLYIGCGEGSLVVYDPEADRFEVLIRGQMSGITWGGCVTNSLVVWSASPGDACVYDWRQRRLLKTFRPLDSEQPPARYGHNVLECPDGKVLLGMNVPQARLVLLDLVTLTSKSCTPEVLKGRTSTGSLTFLDAGRLALLSNNELLILGYPSLELNRRISPPAGRQLGRICLVGGVIYGLSWPDGDLYHLNHAEGSNWEFLREHFVGEESAILHVLADRYVCALTPFGRYLRYDTRGGEVFESELDSTGPMDTHAICVVPQIRRVFGAPYINQRFWDIDLETGRGRDLGRAAPGGGEICCMVWDQATARLVMASYTTCTLTTFDPKAPVSWPDNPRVLGRVGHEQMRPIGLVHDGRFVWLVSSAKYGLLGGALSRIDPQKGEIRVWRNIVPNQMPVSLVADSAGRRIYFATDVHGDCDSVPPTEQTAQLVVFDMDSLTIDRQQTVSDQAETLRLLAMFPTGRILGLAIGSDPTDRTLFTWEPTAGTIEHLGPVPAEGGLSSLGRPGGPESRGQTVAAPDGRVYAAVGDQICKVELDGSGVSFQPIVRTGEVMGEFMQVADGRLYAVVHNELWAIPLEWGTLPNLRGRVLSLMDTL